MTKRHSDLEVYTMDYVDADEDEEHEEEEEDENESDTEWKYIFLEFESAHLMLIDLFSLEVCCSTRRDKCLCLERTENPVDRRLLEKFETLLGPTCNTVEDTRSKG